MTDPGRKLAALAIVVAMVGASLGYAPTTSYFSDGETANVAIEMPVAPVGNVGSDNPVAEGSPVNVTGVSSTDDGTITSYAWDFDGDGEIDATGMNQTHTYLDEGEYGVTLVVTDTAGLTDTATTAVTVENVPPTARAGSDRTVDVDEVVTFDASASSDPGADNLTYEWDLDGDGEYDAGGVEVDQQYRSEGTYAVTLQVSDGDGGLDTDTLSVEVQNVPPTADAGENLTVVTGEPTLDGTRSSEGDSSDTLTYEWDVDDDGTYEVDGAEPGHYYSENGTYNVTLQVSDGDGGTDTDTTTVTVEPDTEPPVADAVTTQTTATNKTIGFNGSGSGDNARIVGYQWDFGDGTTAAGPEVSHTYDDPGDYNVTLTVTDSASYETTANVSIAIENVPPTADAGPDLETTAGTPVTLDGSDSTAGDAHDTLSYGWDLDEDSTYEKSGATAEQIFRDEGTYNVTLRVDDGDGGVDTDTTTVTVENALPVADAGSDRTVPVNETVAFDGSTSSDPDGDTLTYEWDLDGDGAFDESGSNASHTYTANGTYTVTLRVDDGDGGIDTDTIDVTVES
ncbi:PKD domain-containing protein [Halapricum hydrolyticum]|uniref:PKD domain-containing protein n=1 Tax=Halapricum hydrolyticum TaxID=2979991 RepID=A0AAE3ID50_9EURY|nr:PKD domain-containing protein [Halapricum hydrolyticum]MCU4718195.1 PKD domain-containing protein [Halapricum hydrolyticum]MCU4726364.1 PKD domain-containing protein [Halapricum hydrolyticum]